MDKLQKTSWGRALIMTAGALITAIGVYFFKFQNNFSFGGVTGIAVVVSKVTSWSPSAITAVLNILLLLVGLLFLGKSFCAKTAYASILLSAALAVLERAYPMTAPLTNQLFLEFVLAILLPSLGSALLFYAGASGGGTDILAMILQKHTGYHSGSALFVVDLAVTVAAFLVFNLQTGLYALTGLMTKTFAINAMVESLNQCKYFNIICDDPEPICKFINEELHRGATVCSAQGAFSHRNKYVIFTVLYRSQAIQLRSFIKRVEPHAFIAISNSSEIIGKGFQD